MRIDQTTPAMQLPTIAAPSEQTLSKTDWKTHALVVLSYLLVGIGITLAFCAPYIAFTVQPMLAVASPVLPIALGVLGLQYSSEPVSPVKVAAPVKPSNVAVVPPIGIKREGNNCWVNASLQILFNVPVFKGLMENLNNPSDPVLSEIKTTFETYKQGGKVDSQRIRNLLPKLNPKIDPSSQFPEDPILFLEPFLQSTDYLPLKEYGHEIKRENGNVVSMMRHQNEKIHFDLSHHYNKKTTNLTESLNDYFNNIEKKGEKSESFSFFLKEIPEDFSITIQTRYKKIKRPDGTIQFVKKERVVQGAMEVSLPGFNTGKETSYFCDSFIVHSGRTDENGHYIAYLLKDGMWWEANDHIVKSIDQEEANRLIKTAYFRHYQKVPFTQMLT